MAGGFERLGRAAKCERAGSARRQNDAHRRMRLLGDFGFPHGSPTQWERASMSRRVLRLLSAAAAILLAACAATPRPTRCAKDYASIKAQEMATIDRGMEVLQSKKETDMTPEEASIVGETEQLLESRSRPVDEIDVAIIDRAKGILNGENVWDRQDDRVCNDGDTTFSLYCALFFASKELLGEYQHRRTALQEVRFALEEATEGREYEHRLRDFNNDPQTTLAAVQGVLDVARARIVERLALQAQCKL
jgi:hypothetical protein